MSRKTFEVTQAVRAMRELRALEPRNAEGRPPTLPLDAITVHQEVFQPRAMSEHHVHGLMKIIKSQGHVDPVLVWPTGDQIILLDGHHRLRAYAAAEATSAIPVSYFEGAADEALAQSGARNSPLKLAMSTDEKQNFAWRMETLGSYSKAEIARTAGIGVSQVARMRIIKAKLGSLAQCFDRWKSAKKQAEGMETQQEFDADVWKEEQSQAWADRLSKTFTTKFAQNTEVAAMALAIYFGRKLPDLYNQLRGVMTDDQIEQARQDAEGDEEDSRGG